MRESHTPPHIAATATMAAAASGRQLGRPFLEGGNIRVRSRSNTLSAQHAASSVLIASSGKLSCCVQMSPGR